MTIATVTDPGSPPNDASELAWGFVAGVLALAAFGVIVTAAFATSARRQLTTIGQLSANGAPAGVVRRSLLLQGSLSGLIGGLVGVVVAGAVLAGARPLLVHLVDRDVAPYQVPWWQLGAIVATAVVAASVAALSPARSAARIPVLAALAGRRPLAPPRRRLAPLGLASFVGGVLLLAVAAATSAGGNLPAAVAVVGGLGVLAGITTLSPLAVDVAGRVPLSGAGRLALRGIARQRTRSAAVVTAIATVMTIAVAVATIVGDLDDRSPDGSVPSLPADRVMVWPIDVEPTSAATAFRPSDELLGSLAEALPDASSSSWPVPSYERGPGHDQMYANASFLVADDDVLDAIGLSDADRRALQEHGAVAMYAVDGRLVTDGTVTYQVPTAAGTVEIEAAVRQDPPRSWGGSVEVLLAPAQVAELGMGRRRRPARAADADAAHRDRTRRCRRHLDALVRRRRVRRAATGTGDDDGRDRGPATRRHVVGDGHRRRDHRGRPAADVGHRGRRALAGGSRGA